MLKANFKITETGGTGHVMLQSSSDQGVTWQDVGSQHVLSHGHLIVDDTANVSIDTSVFISGQSYQFRLADQAGSPISNVVTCTVPYIIHYVSGAGTIDFVNTGGDNYAITCHAAPTHIYSNDPATVTNFTYKVDFWQSNNTIPIAQQTTTQTTDQTITTGGNGAGVYVCEVDYMLSNGLGFNVAYYAKVDGAGTTTASIAANGSHATSVSGLDVTETANIIQTGVNYPIAWISYDGTGGTVLATGQTASFTLPVATIILIASAQIDHVFSDDYSGDVTGIAHNLIIGP